METVLVTGGTGHLGCDLVRQLAAGHRKLRVLARSPGRDPRVEWAIGDLATGEGIAAALQGVDKVINAATLSSIARRGSISPVDFFRTPRSVDVDGTRRLLEASQRARVAHFIHVSIAGLEDSPLPYSRVKLTGEKLVRQSAVPWSIVRATPFYYLVARLLHSVRWLPLWPLPDAPFHPVDTGDVATYLIACLDDDERGIREEIGGPEVLSFVEVARQYQQASGVHRVIVPLHISPKTARRMGFAEACGRRGTKTWSSWLREHTLAAEPRPTTAPGRR